jgi:hypothetical protein
VQHGGRIAEEAIEGNPRCSTDGSATDLDALLIENEVPPQAMLVVRKAAPPPISPGSLEREHGHHSL